MSIGLFWGMGRAIGGGWELGWLAGGLVVVLVVVASGHDGSAATFIY